MMVVEYGLEWVSMVWHGMLFTEFLSQFEGRRENQFLVPQELKHKCSTHQQNELVDMGYVQMYVCMYIHIQPYAVFGYVTHSHTHVALYIRNTCMKGHTNTTYVHIYTCIDTCVQPYPPTAFLL